MEISYGQWDGQDNTRLLAAYPQYFDPLLQDVLPSYVEVATDGESFAQVQQRVQAFLTTTAQAHPDERIIVVTHGFTVKAMVLAVLKPSDPMSLPEPANTSVTKIVVDAIHSRQYLAYYNRLTQF